MKPVQFCTGFIFCTFYAEMGGEPTAAAAAADDDDLVKWLKRQVQWPSGRALDLTLHPLLI